jgi:hypothetical protein
MARSGSLALIAFAVAGVIWFALELAPPNLGFEDTDDPAVSLRFLHANDEIYAWAGVVLLLMAGCLAAGVTAVADAVAPTDRSLTVRTVTLFGLFASAFFLMHGVLRLGVGPLLYIDGLDADWGQAAYLAIQMLGIHGFGQAATVALCAWAVGLSLVGLRTRVLPLALCLLGIVPAFRLIGILGPLGLLDALPDEMWFAFMASIPGVLLWCLFLGLVGLRRPMRLRSGSDAAATVASPAS